MERVGGCRRECPRSIRVAGAQSRLDHIAEGREALHHNHCIIMVCQEDTSVDVESRRHTLSMLCATRYGTQRRIAIGEGRCRCGWTLSG
uniref:Uncharacterized protein n=1 Tax=Oryza rufipogon TaxID=4529 RepID=A0A0E0RBL2_ORYRU